VIARVAKSFRFLRASCTTDRNQVIYSFCTAQGTGLHGQDIKTALCGTVTSSRKCGVRFIMQSEMVYRIPADMYQWTSIRQKRSPGRESYLSPGTWFEETIHVPSQMNYCRAKQCSKHGLAFARSWSLVLYFSYRIVFGHGCGFFP
jgi:hypothetical protein